MSKSQALRDFVRERLAAAAEDIFALFERTISEYEEELHRSKEENQRKQQLLDSAGPGVLQTIGQSLTPSTDCFIKQEFKEEPEELSLKTEEQPDAIPVGVDTGEQQQKDISSQPHLPDNDEEWFHPVSYSPSQMETETDGEQNQVQITDTTTTLHRQNRSAPETSGTDNTGDEDADRKKYQCSVCKKRFGFKSLLQIHSRVHTGEKPYRCSVCKKEFGHLHSLKEHGRLHTGEKPLHCRLCDKTFAYSSSLTAHVRTHTGERPYSCSYCDKTFVHSSALKTHTRTHTGERPYSCSQCDKTFNQSSALHAHMRTHR